MYLGLNQQEHSEHQGNPTGLGVEELREQLERADELFQKGR